MNPVQSINGIPTLMSAERPLSAPMFALFYDQALRDEVVGSLYHEGGIRSFAIRNFIGAGDDMESDATITDAVRRIRNVDRVAGDADILIDCLFYPTEEWLIGHPHECFITADSQILVMGKQANVEGVDKRRDYISVPGPELADCIQAEAKALSKQFLTISNAVKSLSDNLSCGGFFPGISRPQSNCAAVYKDTSTDFLATPLAYENRNVGAAVNSQSVFCDSFAANGKVWLDELDTRTNAADSDYCRCYGGGSSVEDTVEMLWRDAGREINPELTSKLTGFSQKLTAFAAPGTPEAELTRDGAALLQPGITRIVQIYKEIFSFHPTQNKKRGDHFDKLLVKYKLTVSDPDCISIAVYPDGGTAVGLKSTDYGFEMVYNLPVLNSEFLRATARQAGCNVYAENNDVIYASKGLILLHTTFAGEHAVQLPSPGQLTDLRCGSVVAEKTGKLILSLGRGRTVLLKYEPLQPRHSDSACSKNADSAETTKSGRGETSTSSIQCQE